MFIPFYSEIKAILILFFLLTRARVSAGFHQVKSLVNHAAQQGAEPIYLHIIRPMVKPYAVTLDAVLEFIQQVGDLVLLLCAIPFHLLSSFYYRWISRKAKSDTPEESIKDKEEPEKPSEKQEATETEFGKTRSRKRALHDAHAKSASQTSTIKAPVPRKVAPEIWRPPPPAYDESPPAVPVGLPTPPTDADLLSARNQYVDEWRQYEAFPSAYPATPAHSVSGLPQSSYSTPLSSFTATAQHISDDNSGQVFPRSLQSLRELENPDFEGDLSDDLHENDGVHTDEEMSVDEDYEEEEDDFNVTLATPYPLSRIMNVSNMTAGSGDGGDSVGFDTFDEESPLQTRTNSQASANSQSDSSPTDRKRRLPSPARTTSSGRTVTRPSSEIDQETIRARPAQSRPAIRPPLVSRKQSRGDEPDAQGKDTASVVKKQRAEVSAGVRRPGVGARPLPTKQEENKAPPRKVPATTASRAPLRPVTRPAQRPITVREPTARRLAEGTKEVSATSTETVAA